MTYVRVLLCLLLLSGDSVLLASVSSRDLMRPDTWVLTLAGGVIAPRTPQKDIRMDSVEVSFELRSYTYWADAEFSLYNTGDTTTVQIGFPMHGEATSSTIMHRPAWVSKNLFAIQDFITFDSWVSGRRVEFKEQSTFIKDADRFFSEDLGQPGEGTASMASQSMGPRKRKTIWLVKRVTFQGHATTTIRVRYQAPYCYVESSILRYFAFFYLGTGHYWKGQIAKATFLVDSRHMGGHDQGIFCCNELLRGCVPLMRKEITSRVRKYELSAFDPHPTLFIVFGPDSEFVQ